MNISPHTVADALKCESKAYLRHICGYTTPNDSMKAKAGQAIHAAIAEYLRPGATAPADAALRALHTVYDAAFGKIPADQLDQAYTPANLHRIIDRWMEMNPLTASPWRRVIEVETAFRSRTFEFFDHHFVPLIIRPDAVVERHDGMISFVDTKSTGWHISDQGWKDSLRLSLQFQLYVDGVMQRWPNAYLGGWMLAIEIRNLPGASAAPVKLKKDGTPAKEKLCPQHGVPYRNCGAEHLNAQLVDYKTTPERVARAVEDAKIGAAKLLKLAQRPPIAQINTFGGATESCRFCPGRGWCIDTDRQADPSGYSALVHDPWVVEEGTR